MSTESPASGQRRGYEFRLIFKHIDSAGYVSSTYSEESFVSDRVVATIISSKQEFFKAVLEDLIENFIKEALCD